MQERQDFLDHYFLFSSEWKPPRDYSRASGLVEDVRKAFFEIEERERLEEENAPRELKVHEGTSPLDLAGDVSGSGAGRARQPGMAAPPAANPAPMPAPPPPPPPPQPTGGLTPLRLEPLARAVSSDHDVDGSGSAGNDRE
jgi:general secretion pathway protein D